MKTGKKLISIIIPIYNETDRLENISRIDTFLKSKKYRYEIIVVDDGSNLTTRRLLKSLESKNKIRLVAYKKNMGKGYAVKTGMIIAHGEVRFFTDIDLSVPIENIERFLDLAESNDIVIGTRRKKGSKILEHQPLPRELMGKVYTSISRRLLNLSNSDFTCGFKCFNSNAAKKIFKNTKIHRWGFDTEVMFLASHFKLKVSECPVEWKNDSKTKVKFPEAIITSAYELYKIKKNAITKTYR